MIVHFILACEQLTVAPEVETEEVIILSFPSTASLTVNVILPPIFNTLSLKVKSVPLELTASVTIPPYLTLPALSLISARNKEVDFAFLNAGSIRSGLPKGDITFEHIAQTYPFDSKAVITKMTGQEIMEHLNYGLKTYIPNDRTNPLLQTAGIGYLFSGKTKNIVKTNIKLENEKEYLVVMPSFLANGGDGFKKVNIIQELPEKTIREAFISILATTKMNSFENRIKKMIEK